MKRLLMVLAFAIPVLTLDGKATADDKPKAGDDKPKVEALPPSPLDGAFEKGNALDDITNGLLNNAQFKKAVAAALKAKKSQEQWYKDHPNGASSTPAQAARKAFLDALQAAEENKDKDK